MAPAASLTHNLEGGYRFLAAPGRPFSGGIVADPGLGVVRARFERPLALEQGLAAASEHVETAGRPVKAIAGIELRIPQALTQAEFDSFNKRYVSLLETFGLRVNGLIPAARTNVAPIDGGVSEPSVYAFCYSFPERLDRPSFVLSGIPETEPGTPSAMLDSIIRTASGRLEELGVSWEQATATYVYAAAGVVSQILDTPQLLAGNGGLRGVHWFPSHPPVQGLQLEVDVRSTFREVVIQS
ncbi:MAG: hypothetical protein ACHQ0J_12700 [Candidatus Dormibacterales bacterium]